MVSLICIDVYSLLGSFSQQFQVVEQFPWQIADKQKSLLTILENMQTLNLPGDLKKKNNVWKQLGKQFETIINDTYVLSETADSISRKKMDYIQSVQNKLSSLVRNLHVNFKTRLDANPTPKVIDLMSKCFKFDVVVSGGSSGSGKDESMDSLEKIAKISKVDDIVQISNEYQIFRQRIKSIVEKETTFDRVDMKLIFPKHKCLDECPKDCSKTEPHYMKIVHLFFKEPSLFNGIQSFLHLFLNCIVKTHAESVAESMGSIIERHSDSRRGNLGLEDVGKEAFVSWNGPEVHRCDNLGRKVLDDIFDHRYHWNFFCFGNSKKVDSTVIHRKKQTKDKVPFFQ